MIPIVECDKPLTGETIFSFVVRLIKTTKGNEVNSFRHVLSIPISKVGRAVEAPTPSTARAITAA